MTEWLLRRFVKGYGTDSAHVRTACGSFAGLVGIACNLLLVAGKLTSGILSGSVAVTADGLNNLTDAASSVIALVSFKAAAKLADREHPFGHGRVEYISALVVAVLVLVIGVELAKTSVERIISPAPVEFSVLSVIVLSASVLIKIWMAFFNRGVGKRIGSATLKAASADSRNDAIATFAVLAAMTVSHLTGVVLDGWMGLAVAGFIAYNGIGLVRETLSPLMGEAPSPELVHYVRDKISGYEGVLGTHDLIVHDYGPGRRFASAHVEMASDIDAIVSHDIIDNIERDFMENDNIHLIIHYDPIVTGGEADSARAWVDARVKLIDSRLSIHDLRMVDGPTHTNYVFDCVVPPGFEMPECELLQKIEEVVQDGGKPVHTIVTIDRSYTETLI